MSIENNKKELISELRRQIDHLESEVSSIISDAHSISRLAGWLDESMEKVNAALRHIEKMEE